MTNITNITGQYDQQAYVSGTAENKRVDVREGQRTGQKEEASQDDIVSLSKASRDIQIAKEAVAATEDIRSEKVDQIKQAMEEGDYEVSAEQVAEKIVGSIIDTII